MNWLKICDGSVQKANYVRTTKIVQKSPNPKYLRWSIYGYS